MHIFMHTFHYLMFSLWHFKPLVEPGIESCSFGRGGAQLRQSPPQHLPVQFARSKLHLVGEVSPFDSEFTVRGLLTQMRSGTPSKLAEGDFFQGGYCSLFEKHVSEDDGMFTLRVEGFFRLRIYIYAHIYCIKQSRG